MIDFKTLYDGFFSPSDPTVFEGYICDSQLLREDCAGQIGRLQDFLNANSGTGNPVKLNLKIRFLGDGDLGESADEISQVTAEPCENGRLEPLPNWMGGEDPPKQLVYFFQSEDQADHPNEMCGRAKALVLPGLKFPTTYRNQAGDQYDVVISGSYHVAEDMTGTMMRRWDLTKAVE